jgi:glycosyltransferase involved in cell wall biosynthesis
MRTYVLIAGDFVPWGGMDRANYELAFHLAERAGARVHLVSHSVAPELARHENVVCHPVKKPLDRYVLAEPLLDWTGRRVARRLAGPDTRVITNGGNCIWPDVNWVHAVHAAWDNRDDHAGLLYRAGSALRKRAARRDERRALRAARLVIANSRTARDQIVTRVGVPPERVRTVYFGVEPSVYRPPTSDERRAARRSLGLDGDRPVAVFIGALGHDRNKGFDVLFDAWRRLCGSPRWDADLLVAGAGAEVDLWWRRAAALGLGARIRMLGFTRRVPELLAASDLLVSPTHYEAYGLAVHEALCVGVPVLVTRSAGVAERIPPELSELLLTDPPCAADLEARLRCWREDIAGQRLRVAKLGACLRERTWAHMAQDILDTIGEHGAAPAGGVSI